MTHKSSNSPVVASAETATLAAPFFSTLRNG
ncbi:hypothetical protein ABID25_002981 [Mesorhizobium abyssinicae]